MPVQKLCCLLMHMNRDTKLTICRVCLAAVLAAACAFADPITGSGAWQTFPGALNSDGAPFFDVPSQDGVNGNVGFYLSGYSGAYSVRSLHVTPDWYGDASGDAVTDFYFNLSHSTLVATLRMENTAWSLLNEFGWYDVDNPTVLHKVFSGSDVAGATVTFTPSAHYGYYLTTPMGGTGETYYTQSSLNPAGDVTQQHFAAFRSTTSAPDRMWIGMEDQPLAYAGLEWGGDYNDMVVEIVGSPEPASGLLAGGSLLALAFVLRRMRSRQAR